MTSLKPGMRVEYLQPYANMPPTKWEGVEVFVVKTYRDLVQVRLETPKGTMFRTVKAKNVREREP